MTEIKIFCPQQGSKHYSTDLQVKYTLQFALSCTVALLVSKHHKNVSERQKEVEVKVFL